ncbi:E3 ubiquitin-protein ligase RFWD3-like [Drosophila kikkawai]|uniref:E3 ubiquitin-protein ligase RFWD3-like n=1 Tax=Drosophila kikkawai TaxID=30033 RepID=A0A6P4IYH3_DROKI|nr:E3 ubiquitin-protein ligase RFWD3-like [Drosophila kikkawai]
MSQRPTSSQNMKRGSSSSGEAPLSQQMKQNAQKMNDLVEELQQENSGRNRQPERHNIHMEQFNREREGILLQLQQEMSNYATIQEKFQEQEKSMQLIIQELESDRLALLDELAVNDVMSADSIDDLSEELNGLNDKLNGMTEDTSCPICMSQWQAEGGHRLVSLRCGHLFGNSCIRTALRRSRQCPICMKRAHPADVRKIYGSAVFPN